MSNIILGCPVVIQPLVKVQKSPLTKAFCMEDFDKAQGIIEQTNLNGGSFSLIEQWQINIYQDIEFSDEEFLSLSPENKSLVYTVANTFNKVAVVGRLHLLGMIPPEYPIESSDLINPFMDCALINKTIYDFLAQLRTEQRLLTEKEFECNDKLNPSFRKKSDFTRILGHYRLTKLINELNLKHIKVPKKIVVVKSEDKLSMMIRGATLEAVVPNNEIDIYAQNITPCKRSITREEILELFSIIETANFVDLWPENILVAEDGVYFIDTEFKSFSGILDWKKMDRLGCYIAQPDQSWFSELIKAKVEEYKNKSKLELRDLGGIYHRYLVNKYKNRNNETLTTFVTENKMHIKIAKAVGLFSQNRSYSFSIKDILHN